MSKSKYFGKHIQAFHGSVNGGSLRPFVSVAPNDDGEFGEWLSIRQAESLANNILKAVAYLRKKNAQQDDGPDVYGCGDVECNGDCGLSPVSQVGILSDLPDS
jgi:hypothetical protein